METGCPEFTVDHDGEASETLVVGVSEFGLAGLTAVDYLIDHLGLERTGCMTTEDLPSITPFEDGRPRHHTRFFSSDDVEFTVLAGELFVPLEAARTFGDAVTDWTAESAVEEIVGLSGVAAPHGPDQHDVFFVATDDYRGRVEGVLEPMGGGFLEGVHSEIVSRGIDSPLSVGVLQTPVHPPAQDIDAAIRLIEAFEAVYDVDVDTGPLEDHARELQEHYEALAGRMEKAEEESRRRVAEDRAYM